MVYDSRFTILQIGIVNTKYGNGINSSYGNRDHNGMHYFGTLLDRAYTAG